MPYYFLFVRALLYDAQSLEEYLISILQEANKPKIMRPVPIYETEVSVI